MPYVFKQNAITRFPPWELIFPHWNIYYIMFTISINVKSLTDGKIIFFLKDINESIFYSEKHQLKAK